MSHECNPGGRPLDEEDICSCPPSSVTPDETDPPVQSEPVLEEAPTPPQPASGETPSVHPRHAAKEEPVQPAPASASAAQEPSTPHISAYGQRIQASIANMDPEAAREAANKAFQEFKDRNGFGGSTAGTDVYEQEKAIIPDCIVPEPGEIPIRQFTLATLQNRILGFVYSKAIGRLLLTNKRVIFRAAGRSLLGRNLVQQEFRIEEICGVDARNEYSFRFGDVLIGLLICWLGALTVGGILGFADITTRILLGLLFGIIGCVPFLLMQKHWKLKLFFLGISLAGFTAPKSVSLQQVILNGLNGLLSATPTNGFQNFMMGLMLVLALVVLLMIFLSACTYALRPNLILVFRTASGAPGLTIRRQSHRLFRMERENCGFDEVLPTDEVNQAIQELGALIAQQHSRSAD